jgi:hypothetical protein
LVRNLTRTKIAVFLSLHRIKRTRQDSNLQPSVPKTDALSN